MKLLLLISLFINNPQVADTTYYSSNVTVDIPRDVQAISEKYLALFRKNKNYNGYAIQLYAGVKDKAVRERSAFVTHFPNIQVGILYENLNYIVQFGQFATRLEANNALELIHAKFPRAYIVRTRISYL